MRVSVSAFLVAVGLLIVTGTMAGSAPAERLTIETSRGAHVFQVEMAVTPEQQRTGLMYRRSMPADAGMLFLYDNGSQVTMWMANTFIPLDMVFIDQSGKITRIVERTVPQSTELIGSNGPVRAVLELNGGTTSRLDIRVGDRVRHPVFE
jgi:uncharacterized membrane protein (UPF0127 family)